ncbi:MAG: BREX-1 system phosphatase PglZ type A, partial [Atopostipes sp.]|nr:BREX-1 system phosphatase PglZ type A [Atopostipes sp.]
VITKEFNNEFSYEKVRGHYKLQKDFYHNFVENNKEMTVVIISDAFRYEVAKELVKKMKRDVKFESVAIEAQIGVTPSYTSLGMASLLPHKELEMDEDYQVFVDGKPSTNLVQRETILKGKNEAAGAIQYDDLKKYSSAEMRDFFVGKEVVYIYHNQIDARGDSLNTEDEVFIAAKEAIDEIKDLIVRITNSVSRTRYIVTADHGFIYKRRKTNEADKIERFSSKEDMVNKRFIVSEKDYDVHGTNTMQLSEVLNENEYRVVTVPMSSNNFKFPGGGQNFVHGGISPQESLVPVIQVKTVRGKQEEEKVKISFVSTMSKVTSLHVHLEFLQQKAIGENIKPATYRIAFEDANGQVISNEEIYTADSKAKETGKRIFSLNFNLRDQKYKLDEKYYLVAKDDDTKVEAFRQELTIDIAFAGGFGFDL